MASRFRAVQEASGRSGKPPKRTPGATPSTEIIPTVRLDTVRKAALQEGLQLYRAMFDRSAVGQVVIDFPSFRIDVVNRAFCRMTGYAVDDLLGTVIDTLFVGEITPASEVAERLAAGNTDDYSAPRILLRRDGTRLPVLATVSGVRDEDNQLLQLLTVLQDRTPQTTAEAARRRSDALIEAAIASLPMTFTAFDTDLRFTFVAGGLRRAGTSAADFLGDHVTEHTRDPRTLRALRRALAGKTSTTRTVIKGETYLTLHGPMVDDDAAVVGVVAVSTNITSEVAAEDARRKAEQLRLFIAKHDPLTGLFGRSALIEHLNLLALARHGIGALLVFDLDDFNVINDTLGHEVGDVVLMEIAARVSDAFPGHMVARHGGDQFAVVIDADADRAAAAEAAQRIHHVLDADVIVGSHTLRITAGVGVAIRQGRGSSSTLIGNAEAALSRAKASGTGGYRLYDSEMRSQAEARLRIQGGLRVALTSHQFHLSYQPILVLHTRRVIGYEALLRWTHPERGAIAPEEFIPVAEQSGLIVPIGRWVMETACAAALPLHRDHGMTIAVNVSVRQLLGRQFAAWVESVLASTGLPPSALVVEVTESALMDDVASIRTAFNRLRRRGVRVAIDDFGTGYSSLARLQRLPVDLIKLDRAFVSGVDSRPEARGMAAAILQLSAAIGADIVAEGIETRAEASTLVDLGYTFGQGFLYARPMSIAEITASVWEDAPHVSAENGNRRRPRHPTSSAVLASETEGCRLPR